MKIKILLVIKNCRKISDQYTTDIVTNPYKYSQTSFKSFLIRYLHSLQLMPEDEDLNTETFREEVKVNNFVNLKTV